MLRSCFAYCALIAVVVLAWHGPVIGGGQSDQQAERSQVSALRLVPFPKEVRLEAGRCPLRQQFVLEASPIAIRLLGELIGDELERLGLKRPEDHPRKELELALRLSAKPDLPAPPGVFGSDIRPEDYHLEVRPDGITVTAAGLAGVLHGAHTLCQLIRANAGIDGIPCLTINDWPSFRWRAFQDDMTRGSSSTLETLQREVALGAGFKINLLAYYMEYQFAFGKHPAIGPKDGSLTPEDLGKLVAYARPRHVDILGSQQSFGHMSRILADDKPYKHLRENGDVLTPAREETYQFLDDLYSESVPLLPLPFFNVCCDEVGGLGQGPAKDMVASLGTGGVYVKHMQRIHDLLKSKYGKRMMMWGDIILTHPDRIKDIPTDTIMLTWGYEVRPSFDSQIAPFARSGFEFFVCPGVSNWSRILPDFDNAARNIYGFVRDGSRFGALGVLNTAWEDDGESLNTTSWHGYTWGAECAWNASATALEDFNRRLGAVLFGEKEDHFGQAIELLGRTHRLPGMNGMNNGRFWQLDFGPVQPADRESAEQLLAIVRPAIGHLEACRKQATVNADLLDGFLHGARRMELIGQRVIDRLTAIAEYEQAGKAESGQAEAHVRKAEQLIRGTRDAFESLGKRFRELWLRESKPYALDWTMNRYDKTVKTYGELADRLAVTAKDAEAGKTLPTLEDIGLVRAK